MVLIAFNLNIACVIQWLCVAMPGSEDCMELAVYGG